MTDFAGLRIFWDVDDVQLKRCVFLFDEVFAANPIQNLVIDGVTAAQREARRAHEELLEARFLRQLPQSCNITNCMVDAIADFDGIPEEQHKLRLFADHVTRRASAIVARSRIDAVPILCSADSFTAPAKSADVSRIVIQNLPLPDADTPWRAVLEWRSDEHARAQLRRLRAWLLKSARSGATTAELENELASLIDDYRTYMRVSHARVAQGRWEVILTTAAEVIDNLIRLRLAPAVKALFEIRKQRLHLLDAELRAPGREIAYIVSAADRFGRMA